MRPPGDEKPRPRVRRWQLPVGDEVTCPCGRKFRPMMGINGRCSTQCANDYPSPTKNPGS